MQLFFSFVDVEVLCSSAVLFTRCHDHVFSVYDQFNDIGQNVILYFVHC